ncbi:MAG: CoA transferase, partial [Dehalococcoidia bacterium]
MSNALKGIRVLDISEVYAGPGAAMYLADQGADVIKVEPPRGDNCRTLFTSDYLGNMSKPFLALNRNKRAIVLDLTKENAQKVLHRMVAGSDVVIVNARSTVAKRLALDCETLQTINPRLVYAAISAFGPQGPDAGKPGYDLVLQARAGILAARRYPDGTPVAHSVMVSDMSGASMLAYAITAALFERERTGRGRRIDISLLGMSIAMQAQQLVRVANDGAPTSSTMGNALYSPYRCLDGKYLIPVILTNEQWGRLCGVLGLEHLARDPDYDTYVKRLAHNQEMAELLAGIFETRPRGEWLRLLEEADIPCSVIAEGEEVFNDPQLRANQYIIDYPHPQVGMVTMMGSPYSFDGEPYTVKLPAPTLGQHTDEVLREIGFTETQIRELKDEGILGT